MNPHFPILREPIKVRLVHGPIPWILGDDSPIICQCFLFIPVLSLLLPSIDVHWHIPTPGWQAKNSGFSGIHRPWLQLSIAYGPSPPWDQTSNLVKSIQIKSIKQVEAKGNNKKKVPTNTTVALSPVPIYPQRWAIINYIKNKINALGQIERIECLASQHYGMIYPLFLPGNEIGCKMVRVTILRQVSGGTFWQLGTFCDSPIKCLPDPPVHNIGLCSEPRGKGTRYLDSVNAPISRRPGGLHWGITLGFLRINATIWHGVFWNPPEQRCS